MECSMPQEMLIEKIVKKHGEVLSASCSTLPSLKLRSGFHELPELMESSHDSASVRDDLSEVSDVISDFGDSEDEGSELVTWSSYGSGSTDDTLGGSDASDAMYGKIFTNAIAVTKLVEAAILAHSMLPSECGIEACGIEASASLASVIARLQRVTASPATEQDAGDFPQVVRLLRSAKLMFDEEVATAKVLSAIALLEERFALPSGRHKETSGQQTPEQIALQHEAEYVCAEMARLAMILYSMIRYHII
jgi:hypothetical protein